MWVKLLCKLVEVARSRSAVPCAVVQAALDEGQSIKALSRFDANLRALTLENWRALPSPAAPHSPLSNSVKRRQRL